MGEQGTADARPSREPSPTSGACAGIQSSEVPLWCEMRLLAVRICRLRTLLQERRLFTPTNDRMRHPSKRTCMDGGVLALER
eukprot:scaffold47543_cov32-Tisochrysis_lutea.AAC.4